MLTSEIADTRSRFTGKERDETGLDYFGARYFSGAMGRFTSVDPSRLSIDTSIPQTWNRYIYANNNPLKYIDTNGKWPESIHHDIIDTAFPGLSVDQRNILKAASPKISVLK
jgi:RHS repeat-associated protein